MGKPLIREYKFPKKDLSWKKELEEFYLDIIKTRKTNPNLNDIYKNLEIINNIYKINQ